MAKEEPETAGPESPVRNDLLVSGELAHMNIQVDRFARSRVKGRSKKVLEKGARNLEVR